MAFTADMDADTLLMVARDRGAWLSKSAQLRHSADWLWEGFLAATTEWAKKRRDGSAHAEAEFDTAMTYLQSSKMLYGLAVETALKAVILALHPESVEFELTADGAGKIQHVRMKQFGVSLGASHDLVRLAEKAGALKRGPGELFSIDIDYTTLRQVLDELGELVVWAGRYPVPIRSGGDLQFDPTVPARAHGHYIRDWLDPFLDWLASKARLAQP